MTHIPTIHPVIPAQFEALVLELNRLLPELAFAEQDNTDEVLSRLWMGL